VQEAKRCRAATDCRRAFSCDAVIAKLTKVITTERSASVAAIQTTKQVRSCSRIPIGSERTGGKQPGIVSTATAHRCRCIGWRHHRAEGDGGPPAQPVTGR
jgi:hypothetical protein